MCMSKIFNGLVKALAALWFRLDRRHREIVRRNLAFAYGEELVAAERERLARAVFVHFVRFAWETVVLLLAPLSYIKKQVVFLGEENHAEALIKGRGLVALVAHAGNWEYTGIGYALQYRRLAVVAREMDQPLGRRLARYLRERTGSWMVDKRRGLKEIFSHLHKNRVVGIVIDQNTAEKEGVLVDFFGKPARTASVTYIHASSKCRLIYEGKGDRTASQSQPNREGRVVAGVNIAYFDSNPIIGRFPGICVTRQPSRSGTPRRRPVPQ